MIKNIAFSCMLISSAIAPYKTQILQDLTVNINLPNSNVWQVTENIQLHRWEKSQLVKAQTYENAVIKIEQLKATRFYEQTGRQSVESYLFTRITPKIALNEISYYTNGNTQTSIDAENITQNPTYSYGLWRVQQNVNNEAQFDLLFNLTSYNNQTISEAYDEMMEGFEINEDDTIDSLYYYGNSETNYQIGNDNIVLMEYALTSNGNVGQPGELEDITWDRNYQFFYGQPYKTTLQYNWYADPEQTSGYEVIDVGNLLLTILGMPMAWITQAFNFTLWPGTDFAINVGHVLSAVIIASVIIIIIKKVYR